MTYAELVEYAKRLADEFPAIRFAEEGAASDGQPIVSLTLGTPGKPRYWLYAAAHGIEWEPGYGLLTFARRVAQGRMRDVIDLDEVEIVIVPIFNPYGYDHFKRQNANGVDLNRQGDCRWDAYKGRDSNDDGEYGPWDYDFKGKDGPFTQPEAIIYRRLAEHPNLAVVLDFHGNGSARANKVGITPYGARDDNYFRTLHWQRMVNDRLGGRHLLHQSGEDSTSRYLIDRVRQAGPVPFLMNTSARGKLGVLVELTAGYRSTYGTVLQTDVTCEVCRALFEAYKP